MHFTRLLLKKCVNDVLFLIPFKEPQLHVMLHLEKTTANYNYSFIWEAVISCYPSFFNIFISSEDKNKATMITQFLIQCAFFTARWGMTGIICFNSHAECWERDRVPLALSWELPIWENNVANFKANIFINWSCTT